jgi:hypothetical protein
MIRHISQRQKHNQLRYISELLNEICATTFIKIRDKGYGIHGVQNLVVAKNTGNVLPYAVTGVR